MTQEEKELLLKDLCERLPYGVKIQVSYEECSGYFDETVGAVDNYEPFHINDRCIEYIKPYLFPMSSMTEEEQRTLDSMCNGVEMMSRLSGLKMFDKAFNWLNENHFDYRGIIEKGLAIDATGKKIY